MDFTLNDINKMSIQEKQEALSVITDYIKCTETIFYTFLQFACDLQNQKSISFMIEIYNKEENENITFSEVAMIMFLDKLKYEYQKLNELIGTLN